MISRETINNLKTKWMTVEINVIREYLQQNFLAILYQEKKAGGLLFKGGTALRIAHQSPRFSEDLDFSSLLIEIKEIEGLLEKVLWQLNQQGVNLKITEAKATTDGYLFTGKTRLFEKELEVKLNFASRKQAEKEVQLINSPFTPSYSVVLLAREELVREKIEAFLSRGRMRDYFDLYFILRARLASEILVEKKKEITAKLNQTKVDFADLKPFLPKTFWPLISHLRKNLQQELIRL